MKYLVKFDHEFGDGKIVKKGEMINGVMISLSTGLIKSDDGYYFSVDKLIKLKEHRKNILRCL